MGNHINNFEIELSKNDKYFESMVDFSLYALDNIDYSFHIGFGQPYDFHFCPLWLNTTFLNYLEYPQGNLGLEKSKKVLSHHVLKSGKNLQFGELWHCLLQRLKPKCLKSTFFQAYFFSTRVVRERE